MVFPLCCNATGEQVQKHTHRIAIPDSMLCDTRGTYTTVIRLTRMGKVSPIQAMWYFSEVEADNRNGGIETVFERLKRVREKSEPTTTRIHLNRTQNKEPSFRSQYVTGYVV